MNQRKKNDLLNFLRMSFAGEFLINEPLSVHTCYKIGGPTDFLVYPFNNDDLIELLHLCRSLNIDTYYIGEGANILVSDAGFRGVIIKLTKNFNSVIREDEFIIADVGLLLKDLILYCEKENLGGLEYLSGIPGTVGGALIMNAGTQKGEIGDSVHEIFLLDENTDLKKLSRDKIDFGYRSAPQLQRKTLLGCKFKLKFEKEDILREIRIDQLNRRAGKLPLEFPSCGSVFKRPSNNYVGKMVEELRLKGFRYGGAMISEKHGGFILNMGDAKANDVMYIIEKIKEKVFDVYGVELEPEVRFVGF